jgi:hypothetical protein
LTVANVGGKEISPGICPSANPLSPIYPGDGRSGRPRLNPLGFRTMIAFAAASLIFSPLSGPLACPHAWLGLEPTVREPAVIVQAARRRLEAIRDAHGSEREVKDVLVSIIVTARQEMLSRARVGQASACQSRTLVPQSVCFTPASAERPRRPPACGL